MTQKLKTYETICLTKVDMPEEKFTALMERAKTAIQNEGKGQWLYSDDWGKAKISYKIGKDTRARWTYMRFQSMSAGVDELARGLSINEFVLRQMTCITKEDGSDFDVYRQTMAQDLTERGERRDMREERPYRGGGYRRDYGDRGGDRGGYNNNYNAGGGDQGASDEGAEG